MNDSDLSALRTAAATEILHPTDFSKQSEVALAHALRLALTNEANLTLLHVGYGDSDVPDEFPSIRQYLQRWHVIPEGASRTTVSDLGIGIEKVTGYSNRVVDSIEGYCHRHPIDLIVLATAGRDGLAAWLKPSTAERIAQRVAVLSIPTLFVPAGGRGCVDVESGAVSMDHVLVPVDHQPNSESAVERGLRAIATFGSEHATLTLLHVGSKSKFPHVRIASRSGNVQRIVRKGNAAAEIVAAARECQANLIIMVTKGSEGFLDVLRGSTTSQVLHDAPCPLLAIPADW